MKLHGLVSPCRESLRPVLNDDIPPTMNSVVSRNSRMAGPLSRLMEINGHEGFKDYPVDVRIEVRFRWSTLIKAVQALGHGNCPFSFLSF